MSRGILLIGEHDPAVESRAKKAKIVYSCGSDYQIPYDKTLICQSGTRIPWDLLPAAWNFLNRWDSAVPLWVYGKTAGDLGTKKEQKLTREIIRDLRVLLYSHELLFVRNNESGRALIETWVNEMGRGPDQRLAFLRAYYQVKPRLCVLPVSWLAEIKERGYQRSIRGNHPRLNRRTRRPMTRVEVAPGQFVKCHVGDEDKIRKARARKER